MHDPLGRARCMAVLFQYKPQELVVMQLAHMHIRIPRLIAHASPANSGSDHPDIADCFVIKMTNREFMQLMQAAISATWQVAKDLSLSRSSKCYEAVMDIGLPSAPSKRDQRKQTQDEERLLATAPFCIISISTNGLPDTLRKQHTHTKTCLLSLSRDFVSCPD